MPRLVSFSMIEMKTGQRSALGPRNVASPDCSTKRMAFGVPARAVAAASIASTTCACAVSSSAGRSAVQSQRVSPYAMKENRLVAADADSSGSGVAGGSIAFTGSMVGPAGGCGAGGCA